MKLKCLLRKGGQLFPDDKLKFIKTQSQLETVFLKLKRWKAYYQFRIKLLGHKVELLYLLLVLNEIKVYTQ